MNIDYDDFIRTTDERHVKVVQKIFRKLYEQGDIYKSRIRGPVLHADCESFWTPTQLKDGNAAPTAAAPCETAQEESYFFRMSKYAGLADRVHREPPGLHPAAVPRQ